MEKFEKELKQYSKSLEPTSAQKDRVRTQIFEGLGLEQDSHSIFKLLTRSIMEKSKGLQFLAVFVLLFTTLATPLILKNGGTNLGSNESAPMEPGTDLRAFDSDNEETGAGSDKDQGNKNVGGLEPELEDVDKVFLDIVEDKQALQPSVDYDARDEVKEYTDSSNGVIVEPSPSADGSEDLNTPQGERAVERSGKIKFQTSKIEEVFNKVQDLTGEFGGYIVKSSYQGETSNQSTITLRIPVDNFEEAVARIKDMDIEILSEDIRTLDRQNRLTELETIRQDLQTKLDAERAKLATTTDEAQKQTINQNIAYYESRLQVNAQDTEEVELDTTYSTLSITMHYEESSALLSGDFETIFDSAKVIIVFWATVLLYAAVPLIISILVYKKLLKKKGNKNI